MEMNTIQKPLTVLRDEFLNSIMDLCNNAGLPYFVIEGMLKDIIADVHTASIRQQQSERAAYERALAKHREAMKQNAAHEKDDES